MNYLLYQFLAMFSIRPPTATLTLYFSLMPIFLTNLHMAKFLQPLTISFFHYFCFKIQGVAFTRTTTRFSEDSLLKLSKYREEELQTKPLHDPLQKCIRIQENTIFGVYRIHI